MRAFYFAKPLEFHLEVEGEEFVQGDTLSGSLRMVNRGADTASALNMDIGLAYGLFREIKEEGNQALKILERHCLAEKVSLKPGGEKTMTWSIPLGADAPIRSKEGAPFLLYGTDLSDVAIRGQIDLPVELSPPAAAFIATLENHYAFEARSRKAADGVVQANMKPPGSYPTLDELTVSFRIDDKAVHLELYGKGKGIQGGEAGGLKVKAKKASTSVPLAEFGFGRPVPNRALYRELIDTLLPKIATRRERKK